MKLVERTHNIDKAIGAVVKSARQDIGMSQEALSARLGVTFQQMQKYEKGKNRIALSTFLLICHVMDVPAVTMFDLVLQSLASEDYVLENVHVGD